MIKQIVLSAALFAACLFMMEQPGATGNTVGYLRTAALEPTNTTNISVVGNDTSTRRLGLFEGVFGDPFQDEKEAIHDRWDSFTGFFTSIGDFFRSITDDVSAFLGTLPDPLAKFLVFIMAFTTFAVVSMFAFCLGAGCFHCCKKQCCPLWRTNIVNINDEKQFDAYVRIKFRRWLAENQREKDEERKAELIAKRLAELRDLEKGTESDSESTEQLDYDC